ncbi:hypothetical protein HUG17_2612 [Dermatophagoides farinae]|nr:hypothetical protein HUG17_2612 [Dermatophagoides farinae]
MALISFISICLDVDKYAQITHEKNPEISPNEAKTATMAIGVVIFIISLTFSSIGLFGAIKENYCLSITYSLLWLIELINSLVKTIASPIHSLGLIINLIIFAVLILFIIDLRQKRQTSQSPSPSLSPPPPLTTTTTATTAANNDSNTTTTNSSIIKTV